MDATVIQLLFGIFAVTSATAVTLITVAWKLSHKFSAIEHDIKKGRECNINTSRKLSKLKSDLYALTKHLKVEL